MPGPLPKPSGTRARGNKSATKATLKPVENPEIPPMPNPAHWLQTMDESQPDPDEFDEDGKRRRGRPRSTAPMPPPARPEWNPAVEAWWDDIWSSPMSQEFHASDVHGLYLACFYLHQTLSPWVKMSDRLAAAGKYEAAVKNFGLNPMSRRSLQWEIEKAEEARDRGERRRSAKKVPGAKNSTASGFDPRTAEETEKPNPFRAV